MARNRPTAPTTPAPQHVVIDVNLNVNIPGLADLFGGPIRDTLSQIVSTLQSQDQDMADIKQELKDLKGDVGTLHTAVTGAVSRIGDLTNSVKDLNDKLAQNPSDDPEVQQLATDLHNEITSMGSELAAAGQAVTPPTDIGTAPTGTDTGTGTTDQGGAPA
jgi:uncharacterized protein YoxC